MGYKKLHKHVKTAWLDALRSGRYEQTEGLLRQKEHRGYSYCCLGVLCNIGDKSKQWNKDKDPSGNWIYGPEDSQDINSQDGGMPPPHVYELANLSPTAANELAEMNDNGESFKYIADWIEKNL